MNWLIIQSDGQHRGQDGWSSNWFLRECYSLQDALIRNGQQADIWGLRHPNYSQVPDFNSYGAILVVENYEMEWLPDFSKVNAPIKVQWIIDLHCQPWDNYLRVSETMDFVLHSTLSSIPVYERQASSGLRHFWFPNAIDDRFFNQEVEDYSPESRPTGALFIGGRGPGREDTLARMERDAGLVYKYGVTGHDYIRALRGARIGFNKNSANDLNYRTFEVLGCGACLLTQRDWALEKLGFVDGENCVLYESDDSAVDSARALLASGRWAVIARAGYALSKSQSYFERVRTRLLPRVCL